MRRDQRQKKVRLKCTVTHSFAQNTAVMGVKLLVYANEGYACGAVVQKIICYTCFSKCYANKTFQTWLTKIAQPASKAESKTQSKLFIQTSLKTQSEMFVPNIPQNNVKIVNQFCYSCLYYNENRVKVLRCNFSCRT